MENKKKSYCISIAAVTWMQVDSLLNILTNMHSSKSCRRTILQLEDEGISHIDLPPVLSMCVTWIVPITPGSYYSLPEA